MTPLYLSSSPPSLADPNDDHQLQFLKPPTPPSCPSVVNTSEDQRGCTPPVLERAQQDGVYISGQPTPSCSLKPVREDKGAGHSLASCKEEGKDDETLSVKGSVKWMSSKMRLMQKIISSSCMAADKPYTMEQTSHHDQQSSRVDFPSNIRVCSDCNTTTTPLWRSGPRGPKSLCNACGIRQRKARKAMAEATESSEASCRSKVQNNKEKKPRTNHSARHKKQCRSPNTETKLCLSGFAQSLSDNSPFSPVFPRDEEQAAILLMELSCGLIHG